MQKNTGLYQELLIFIVKIGVTIINFTWVIAVVLMFFDIISGHVYFGIGISFLITRNLTRSKLFFDHCPVMIIRDKLIRRIKNRTNTQPSRFDGFWVASVTLSMFVILYKISFDLSVWLF